jgi:hypothetical protein
MLFDMRLGGFRSVVLRVLVVTASQVRVMCCRLVFARLVVLRGFPVMSSCMFMMLCCLVMMLCCLL